MDIAEHKKEFMKIIDRYELSEEHKANEIADFLTKKRTISVKEFSTLFAMAEKDAAIFLSFIEKGVRFKEKHLDK